MSDVHDDTVADLEARLTRALRTEAGTHYLTTPSAAAIRAAAGRRDRRRRVELAMAVLAAAAIVVVLIVGPWRGDDDAYVDSGPSDPKAPLHLVLDRDAGFELNRAIELRPDAEGRPPGTVPGPEGRSSYETIVFAGSDPLTPPWYVVGIRTMANPTGPWGDAIASNEQPATVGDRPARLRSSAITPNPNPEWTSIALKWDEHREVTARFWGLDPQTASDALATLHQDDSGTWTIGSPPAGLHELARDVEAATPGWYQDRTAYRDSTPNETPMYPELTLTRTADLTDAELIADVVTGRGDSSTTLERISVRGQPALLETTGDPGAVVGMVPRYRVLWFEPEHQVVADLVVFDADRAELDRVIASLREVGEAEWRAMLTTCTDVTFRGTVASMPSYGTGGICPGYDLGSGG